MTRGPCLLLLLTYASLICSCIGQDSIVSVAQRLDEFQEEIVDAKDDMIRMEKRIINGIGVAKTTLRAELQENIRDEVRKAMTEILQGESLRDMVKSQIVSELRHLKQGYHQMKRQLHHVSGSLDHFQNETTLLHESLPKKTDVWNQENSCDICVKDKQRLALKLQSCDDTSASLKSDIMKLKETCQSQMSRLTTNVTAPVSTPAPLNVTSSPKTSPSTTTSRPEEVKSRILIAPFESGTRHQFRQLSIYSNSLSVYPSHNMRRVTSLAYIAKTNKLLIGLHNPNKIVSSTLDTRHVTVLREHVWSQCMAVDEDQDIVFVSTYKPQYSVSRMSTQEKGFTAIIDLSGYWSYPRQITLDTKRKRIYWCNYNKLLTVTYDGQGLTTLVTGSKMYAVTLDQTAGVLYYGIEKKLMKMTVSNNVSTDVTTLDAEPWNMRLYRGTIYYSGWVSPIVGAVNMTYNTVAYTLQSVSMKGAYGLCMCLIP